MSAPKQTAVKSHDDLFDELFPLEVSNKRRNDKENIGDLLGISTSLANPKKNPQINLSHEPPKQSEEKNEKQANAQEFMKKINYELWMLTINTENIEDIINRCVEVRKNKSELSEKVEDFFLGTKKSISKSLYKIENTFEEMNTNIGQNYNETFGKISRDVNEFNEKVTETFKRVFKIKI
jgi:hypothetical protein